MSILAHGIGHGALWNDLDTIVVAGILLAGFVGALVWVVAAWVLRGGE